MRFFRKRRRADREARRSTLSSVLPLRFDRVRNTNRKTPTCMRGATGGELCSWCFPRVLSQDREQKDKMTPCHDTQLELNFATLLCRERRQTDPDRTFFLSVFFFFFVGPIECETRIAKLSPVTCMRGATVQCFQLRVGVHVYTTRVVERTKRHKINGTILSQKKTNGFTASASFRLRFRFDRLRDTDREAPTCHVYAKLLQATLAYSVPTALRFARAG